VTAATSRRGPCAAQADVLVARKAVARRCRGGRHRELADSAIIRGEFAADSERLVAAAGWQAKVQVGQFGPTRALGGDVVVAASAREPWWRQNTGPTEVGQRQTRPSDPWGDQVRNLPGRLWKLPRREDDEAAEEASAGSWRCPMACSPLPSPC
jgi:hypothetical protein